MNVKRLILSIVAVFVFVFLYEWLVHGVLIKPMYEETAELWRTPEECAARVQWLFLGQLMLAAAWSLLFAWGARSGSVREGVTMGGILTLGYIAHNSIIFAVAAYPPKLIAAWDVGAAVEMLCVGVLLGLIYKPRAATPLGVVATGDQK